MPLKPHTERRQEFGQGRTTYPSQAAPNIGEGNIPISKYMFAKMLTYPSKAAPNIYEGNIPNPKHMFAKMYNLPIQSCTEHI